MSCHKLFTTSNKVGFGVRYVPGTTQIASMQTGGVCLAMVLTWVKESLRYEAAGKSIAKTENDITGGGSLNRIAMLHHSLKFRMRYARQNQLGDDVLNEISADYLYAFGLREADTTFQPAGNLSDLSHQLVLMDGGYHLMLIFSSDFVHEHAFGFKVATGGTCYFLDPNAGLWDYDEGEVEMFNKTAFYIKGNYSDKTYAGGIFGTSKLVVR